MSIRNADSQLKQHKQVNIDELRNQLQQLTSYVIQGDVEYSLFELFMEENCLALIYSILELIELKPQIVSDIFEAISSLLLNVKGQSNKVYLLSHQCVQSMVAWRNPFEVSKPNLDIVEVYICFLNSLAIKVDEVSAMFFINIKHPHFPLLWNAVRFSNFPELMVRNKSRSIVLNLFKVNNSNIKAFIHSFPFISYYYNLGNHLLQSWKSIDSCLQTLAWNQSQAKWISIQQLVEESAEQIQYIHDLMLIDTRLEQLLLIYTLSTPIRILCQVIKYGTNTLLIRTALQLYQHLVHQFRDMKSVQQYMLIQLQQSSRESIDTARKEQWGYQNCWDLDFNTVTQLSRQVYDTLEEVNINKLVHDNYEIRQHLIALKQLNQLGIPIYDQSAGDYLVTVMQAYLMQEYDIVHLIIQIFEQLIGFINDYTPLIELIPRVFISYAYPLTTQIALLNLLSSMKQTVDIKHTTNQLFSININLIISLIDNYQSSVDDLLMIVNESKLNTCNKEFTLLDFLKQQDVNVKQAIYYVIPQLNKDQLRIRLLLNQHTIFKDINKQQIIQMDQIKCQQYTIGQQVQQVNKWIKCQYSQTGHFLQAMQSEEVCYITDAMNYLHIVIIIDTVIHDIYTSKLYYQLEYEIQDRVPTVRIMQNQDTIYWIKFEKTTDVEQFKQQFQQQKQQFIDWYKSILIQQLRSLIY